MSKTNIFVSGVHCTGRIFHGGGKRVKTESLIKVLGCPSCTKLSTSLCQLSYVMALSEEESLNIGRFSFFSLPFGPRWRSHLHLW